MLIIGKILTPHGLKGNIKIISYAEPPKSLFTLPVKLELKTNNVINVKIFFKHNIGVDKFICSLQVLGDDAMVFDTKEAAQKLSNKFLLVNKSALPEIAEDEFYAEDLKGKIVINPQQQEIGFIKEVLNFGAGDIIEIKFYGGQSYLFPFKKDIFPDTDYKDKILFVEPCVY